MISPNTEPGTKVAFIRTPRSVMTNEVVVPFNAGDEVTIEEIFPEFLVPSGYAAHIAECDRFYCLTLFRRTTLPECLLSALHTQPIKHEANAEMRLLMPY